MITTDQFKTLFPKAKTPEAWAEAINRICPRWQIDTPKRLAMFLDQCGHESLGFTTFVENLNYSATALLQYWPKRFTTETAQQYARKPEAIANHVYAGRMGNGDEASGDGWRFRGHGPLQNTGRANRAAFAKAVKLTLEAAEGYIATIDGGIESACWFWLINSCNSHGDAGDVLRCTRVVNGGTNGLADRQALYERACKVLEVTI